MRIPIHQVDAFTDTVFSGNPAAVCPLEDWLPDALMQSIAAENNLSETAFLVPDEGGFSLRWFTPTTEVELCGHATLASAYVVFEKLRPGSQAVRFKTRWSGELGVVREGDLLAMDFPSHPPRPCSPPSALIPALGLQPREIRLANDNFLAVLEDEAAVRGVSPDLKALEGIARHGLIVTAPGDTADFVSRYFAPAFGVDEDPVTGSTHCALAPYWSQRLHKHELVARQISPRGGTLHCTDLGDRVRIAGHVVPYLEGHIEV